MRSLLAVSLVGVAIVSTSCGSNCRSCDPSNKVVNESYVHKYGVQVDKTDWAQRGSDGKVISTQKDGVVLTKNYVQGKLEGETTYTFPFSREVEKVETYRNNQLVKETRNYPSGIRKEEITYDLSNPSIVRIAQFFESGRVRSSEVFEDEYLLKGEYFNPNGGRETNITSGTGSRINRDQLGSLISSETFVEGMAVEEAFFHPNGSPKEIVSKKQGVFNGLRRFYLPGGEPLKTETWVNGSQSGLTTMYQNGERYAEVPYVSGVKHGVEKRFRDDEFVVEEITWLKGKQHGPAYTHFGSDTTVDWYWNGKHVSKAQFDRLAKPRMQ